MARLAAPWTWPERYALKVMGALKSSARSYVRRTSTVGRRSALVAAQPTCEFAQRATARLAGSGTSMRRRPLPDLVARGVARRSGVLPLRRAHHRHIQHATPATDVKPWER